MKRVIYSGTRVSRLKAIAIILLSFNLCALTVQSQNVYYSAFDNTTGVYSVTKPGCLLGLSALSVPDIINEQNVSTASLTDYATLTSTELSLAAVCTGVYRVSTDLNIGSLTTIDASPTNSYNVGFRVSVSEAVRTSLLSGSNGLTLVTYNGNTEKQRSAVSSLSLSLLQSGVPLNISFLATQPFNRVAVEVSSGLLTLAAGASIDFYFAFATNDLVVLPVKLTSFVATAENKSVAINWATASETNAAQYEIQRSSDGGSTFSTITTIAAKGNTTTETKYTYTDGTALNSSYIYRLKMTDKDGKAEFSKTVAVKLFTGSNWKIYPTLLNSGTDLNVRLAISGKAQVQLSNLQGQVLRSISTSTDSRLIVTTGGLSAGIYVLKLYKDGQLQGSEKVVVQ